MIEVDVLIIIIIIDSFRVVVSGGGGGVFSFSSDFLVEVFWLVVHGDNEISFVFFFFFLTLG